MTSWKTTTVGILALMVLILGIAQTVIGQGFGAVEWGTIIPAVLAAVTALFARDNDKSSEDVGAK
jgi:hypothetical protein